MQFFKFVVLLVFVLNLTPTKNQNIKEFDLSVRILPNENRYISLDLDYEEFDQFKIDTEKVNQDCKQITKEVKIRQLQQQNQDGEVRITDLQEKIIKMYKFPISSPSVVQGLIISESGWLFYFDDVFSSSEKTKQSIQKVFQPEQNEICYDFIRFPNGLLMVCKDVNQNDKDNTDFGLFIPIHYDKDTQKIYFDTQNVQKLYNFNRKMDSNCNYDIEYRESLIVRFCENQNTNQIEFWHYNFINVVQEDGESYELIQLNFLQLWESNIYENMTQLKFLLSNYIIFLDENIGLVLLQISLVQDDQNNINSLDLTVTDQFTPSTQDQFKSFQLVEKYGNTSINSRFIQNFVDIAIISQNYIYLMSGELQFSKLRKQIYYKQSLIQLLGQQVIENSVLLNFKADESNFYLYLDDKENNKVLIVVRYYYDRAFSVKATKTYTSNNYIFVYQMPAVFYKEIRLRTFIVTLKEDYSVLTMTNSVCNMLIIQAQKNFDVHDEKICQFSLEMYQKNKLANKLEISLFGTQIDNDNIGYYSDTDSFNFKFSKPQGEIYLDNFYGPALNYTIANISSQQEIFWYEDFYLPFDDHHIGQYFPLNSNGVIHQVYTLVDDNLLLTQECSENSYCYTYLLGYLDKDEKIDKVFFCEQTQIFLVMTDKSKIKGRRYLLGSDSIKYPCNDFQFKYPITDYNNFYQTLQGNMVAFHSKARNNKCLFLSFPFDLNNLFGDQNESIFYNLDCLQFSSNQSYLDMSLLDQGYIFAKQSNEINLFFIDYAFNSYIKGVYSYGNKLLKETKLNNFDFVLVRTARTKMLIIDYDTNEILEYILYTFEEPIFSRKYATFGKKFDPKQKIQKCNDMVTAFTTDGEIMVWWTQGESVDNLAYILPNISQNAQVIPQINLSEYDQYNFVMSVDNYKVYLGKHNNISTKLIGYDNDSKKIVKSQLNIFSNLNCENKIEQELIVNFDNQELFIINNEDVVLPQFEIDYNPIIKIYPDQLYQGPIEKYDLSGNNVDAFRLSPFLNLDGEGYTLNMKQGELVYLIALSDYFLTLSILNDETYLTVMNQKQVFESRKYIELLIHTSLNGVDLNRGGYVEINKIRSEIRGDQYNILIKDKFQESQQYLNQETSSRKIIFIDLTLFTSEEKDWDEAIQNKRYINIDKIRQSAYSNEFFSINLNKIIQIIPMEFSKKLFFMVSVYQSSIDYKNQKDCILYMFVQDTSVQDGEYISLILLSQITSTDLQQSWLEIGDLYESKARLASNKNFDIYNITILFHDYTTSINLLKYQVNVSDLTAKLIQQEKEEIDFLKQYDDNLNVQIIQQLYKLSSDQQLVSVTLVTDYILITAHYNVQTLKRDQHIQAYQDYTGCRVQVDEFEEGQVSQRGDYLVQYCEPTQYMRQNLPQSQSVSKYLKLYINCHGETNHSIQQMVRISSDIQSQHIIMRFNEDNKGDIYGLNIFAIHQNGQMLVAYRYKIKDHLEITNTELITTIKNQKDININLIAKNNFSPSVPHEIHIRGFVPENWSKISVFIIFPIIVCLGLLIYHCIVQTQRSQKRMDRHIQQFNDTEKPLLEQQNRKDLLLQKMIKNKGKTHSGSSNDMILLDISKIIGSNKNNVKSEQNNSDIKTNILEKIDENKLDESVFTSSDEDSDDDFQGDQFYHQKQQIQQALDNDSKIHTIN